jgi:hypothetical protein
VSATPAGQPRIYGSESTSQDGSLDLTTARPGASRAIANRSHFEWIMAASPAHLVCGRGLKRGLQSREPWARCSQPNAVFGGGSSARPAGLAQSLDSRDAAAVGERPWYGFLQPAARISGLHARQNISPGEARRFRLALRLAEPWIGSGKVEVPIVVARAAVLSSMSASKTSPPSGEGVAGSTDGGIESDSLPRASFSRAARAMSA